VKSSEQSFLRRRLLALLPLFPRRVISTGVAGRVVNREDSSLPCISPASVAGERFSAILFEHEEAAPSSSSCYGRCSRRLSGALGSLNCFDEPFEAAEESASWYTLLSTHTGRSCCSRWTSHGRASVLPAHFRAFIFLLCE